MNKYYFTYGSDERFPFFGGWTVVYANSRREAIAIFRAANPDREGSGCYNAASCYTEEEFAETDMGTTGNLGAYCHQILKLQNEILDGKGEN